MNRSNALKEKIFNDLKEKYREEIEEKNHMMKEKVEGRETIRINVIETDFNRRLPIMIRNDIYSQTIAANHTGNIPAMHLAVGIKLSAFTFFLQMFVYYFFVAEYLDFKRFKNFEVMQAGLRLICSLLLHKTVYSKV